MAAIAAASFALNAATYRSTSARTAVSSSGVPCIGIGGGAGAAHADKVTAATTARSHRLLVLIGILPRQHAN
jgi:hypothetical protein